ncbi:bifunctional hydroxylase/dehydrase [Thermomonospora echinospora]|uniref:Bifunctional hydroxylase/dehydrase n=1 Tax=Thermomonospora echinospora TaxID=1992 RepID=A0A1H5VG05_9ACTN|nr:FAD-dependent monooxygenase [Thermomonospora echinospora]SEF85437.1 bifunctional hydroxylase/dehydrase [Thermomonospora echinospora]
MDAEVIIAGAGPAGLMLAGELRLGGVDVVVVERSPRPAPESRALGFTARTMEVFAQRGILPLFGKPATTPFGHFGGVPLDIGVLDAAHFAVLGVPQSRTEAVLTEWATGLGVRILRGHELISLSNNGENVEATIHRTGENGSPEHLRAAYLVGCDGGRSTVRRLAGFDFPGTPGTVETLQADVRGVDVAPRPPGTWTPGGMVIAAPIGDGITRVILCERGAVPRDRTAPVTFAELAAVWKRLTGEDIGHGEPVWVTAATNATRQVTEYRRGRVLLAGDAAHIHLPTGGQGLNVSIQDSANLGWKLAAQVRGWAPPGLLDSYHDERHPVGTRLLLNTRAQGLLVLGGEEMQPLRDVLTELVAFEDVARHLAGMVTGLDVRYDVGPGDHRLLGLRMPHHELKTADGAVSIARLLYPARGLLLDLADDPRLRRAAAGWADRVDVVTASPGPLEGTDALLIRPDGHVVWAAPGCGEPGPALRRWFGDPRP